VKKLIKKTLNYYEASFTKYGNNYKGMNWPSKKGQYTRFEELIKIANLNDKTIHDVGCGNGEFLKFLNKKNIKFKFFYGSDISKIIINQSKQNFNNTKNVKFECIDILKQKKIKKFDYVFASGIFNVKNNFDKKSWNKHVFRIIKKLSEISRNGCSFNLMTPFTTYRERKIYYQSIDELVKYLRNNISKKIIINHSYNLWEYTVYVYKNKL